MVGSKIKFFKFNPVLARRPPIDITRQCHPESAIPMIILAGAGGGGEGSTVHGLGRGKGQVNSSWSSSWSRDDGLGKIGQQSMDWSKSRSTVHGQGGRSTAHV